MKWSIKIGRLMIASDIDNFYAVFHVTKNNKK